MSRPKSNNPRSIQMNFRCTVEEHSFLSGYAKENHMSMTDVISRGIEELRKNSSKTESEEMHLPSIGDLYEEEKSSKG